MLYEYRVSSVVKTLLLCFVLLGFGGVFVVFFPRVYDVIIILLVLYLITINNSNISNKLLIVWCLTVFIFALHGFFTKTVLLNYVGLIFKLLEVILIVMGFNADYLEIKAHLIKALKIIMILACINLFIIQFPFLFYNVVSEKSGYTVQTCLYIFNYLKHAVYQIGNFSIIRNQGVYWEPGILQAIMNILIYYRTIERNQKISSAKWPILVVLSTFSTTGYIILAVILLYKFKKASAKNNMITLVSASLAMILFLPLLINELKNKFVGKGSGSAIARSVDLYIGISLILKNFWLGMGYEAKKYVDEIKKLPFYVKDDPWVKNISGNTNGILNIFIFFGVPIGLYLLYILYHQNIFQDRKIIFVIFFLLLLSEPLVFTNLFLLLLISSIKLKHSNIIYQKYTFRWKYVFTR
jgi:hypothetical protein